MRSSFSELARLNSIVCTGGVFDGPILCANCVPTAQNSVEMGAITQNVTCKISEQKRTIYYSAKVQKRASETAKPLFIHS
jgi:hypothetical protein